MPTPSDKLYLITESARSRSASLPDTLRALLTLAMPCFNADRAALLAFNPIVGDRIGYLATENVDLMIFDHATQTQFSAAVLWVEETAQNPDFASLASLGRSLAVLSIGETRYRNALALLYLGYDSLPHETDLDVVAAVYIMHAHTQLEQGWARYRHELVLRFSQDLYQTTAAPDELFARLNQEFNRVIDVQHGWSMSLVQPHDTLHTYRAAGGSILSDRDPTYPPHPLIRFVLGSKQNLLIQDLQAEAADLIAAGAIPLEGVDANTPQSWLVSPLRWGEVCIGVLTVTHPQARHFDHEDMALLELLGNHVEVALRNLDQSQSVRAMLDRLRLIDKSIIDIEPLEATLEHVLEAVRQIIPHVDEAAVLTLVPGTDDLMSRVAFGENCDARLELRIARGTESHVRDVFDDPKREYGLENDVLEARRRGTRFMTISESTRHELDVKIGKQGMLNLESSRSPFSSEDVENARLIAGQAGIALQNHDLLERYQKLVALQRAISIAPQSSQYNRTQCRTRMDETLYRQLLETARQLNWAHYASLFLIDESEHGENGNFVHMVRFAQDVDPDLENEMTSPTPIPVRLRDDMIPLYETNSGIVGTQVNKWLKLLHEPHYTYDEEDFRPVRIGDVQTEPYASRYRGYFRGKTRSEMVVPIMAFGGEGEEGSKPHLIGVINFESITPDYFTTTDAEIARELAQIAVLIRHQARAQYYEMVSMALHEIDMAIIDSLKADKRRRDQVDAGMMTQQQADEEASRENGKAVFAALRIAAQQFCADRAELHAFTHHRRRVTSYRYDSGSLHQSGIPQNRFYPIQEDRDLRFPRVLGTPVIDYLIPGDQFRQRPDVFRVFEPEKDARLSGMPANAVLPPGAMAVTIREKAGEEDKLIGVLYLESQQKNQFLKDDLDNLIKFVGQIRIAHQISDKVESLQRARRRLTAMREAASALSGAKTLNEAYKIVFEQAKKMLENKRRPSDRYAIILRLYDRVSSELKNDGTDLRLEHNMNLLGLPIRVGKGVTGYAVAREYDRLTDLVSGHKTADEARQSPQRSQIAVMSYSTDSEKYRTDIDHILREETIIRSIITMPICVITLMNQVEILGALTITVNEYYYFSTGDVEFLRTLAMQLVETVRRIEQAEFDDAAQLGTLMLDIAHPIIDPGAKFNTSWAGVRQVLERNADYPLDAGLERDLRTIDDHARHWENVRESIRQIEGLRNETQARETLSMPEIRGRLQRYIDDLTIMRDNHPQIISRIHTHAVPDDITLQLVWDTFSRSIGNLVKNSVEAIRKNGPANGVIRFDFTRTQDNRFMMLRVMDDGPGIPVDLRHDLFKLGKTSKRKEGGTGIGLYVAKMLLKQQGIDIQASNPPEPERGAVFELFIPIMSYSQLR